MSARCRTARLGLMLALSLAGLLSLATPALAGPARGSQAPAGVSVPARIGERYLEAQQADGSYAPVYVKGMNFSVALPGRFPSEIPYDEALYRRWLGMIAEMNCNVIRVYTILTPEFYRAFRWHNQNHPQRLWLMHGIWAEPPPGGDYLDAGYMDALEMEMRHAVDAVHGTAVIHPRPGHAEGLYTADVSPWLLGWIIGREWEPHDIDAFHSLRPDFTTYRGELISAYDVQPIEAWLARLCDYTATYQQQRYKLQLPVTFSNWPPTDPLSHTSESNIEEEAQLAPAGVPGRVADTRVEDFSNDAVNLSAAHFTAEPAFAAGIFSSYHVYPYYPDFLDNEAKYQSGQDRYGPSTYAAYLADLKAYYADRPLVISEYGLPNGAFAAHMQKQGWHHGGLSEAEVAMAVPRLTEAIRDTGCAGGCVFAWIDEWFKKVWLWTDMYDPYDDIRLWFNPLDAEQNYGMLALRPALPGTDPPRAATTLSGNLREWDAANPVGQSDRRAGIVGDTRVTDAGVRPTMDPAAAEGGATISAVRAMHDQAHLHLAIMLEGVSDTELRGHSVTVGFDVLDSQRGNFAFPGPLQVLSDSGLECAVVLEGGRARLYQTSSFRFWTPYKVPYQLAPRIAEARPYVLEAEDNAYAWTQPVAEVNRRRIGRDGAVYPPQSFALNPLPGGALHANDLSLWNTTHVRGLSGGNAVLVELRIPWMLLGFVGPQQLRVLQSAADGTNSSVVTDGVRLGVVLGDRRGGIHAAWPALHESWPPQVPVSQALYTWEPWDIEALSWYEELKPVYRSMQTLLGEM